MRRGSGICRTIYREILGVTDIRQAREAQIFPLPSRAIDADGNVVVTQYEPGAGPTIAPYVATAQALSDSPG